MTAPSVLRSGVVALAAALALVPGGSSRADIVRGQITECGEPATDLNVRALVSLSTGFRDGFKPCTITTDTIQVAAGPVDAQGKYSLSFARPVRDEDMCSFTLRNVSVEVREAAGGALVWRSPTRTFGASTTFVFDHEIDCPPPPPPPPPTGDPMTVRGQLLLCGQPATGFKVAAVTEVRLGFDETEFGGRPCEFSQPQFTQAGTTTVGGDGIFSLTFGRPINPTPEDTCGFKANVFINLIDPVSGGVVWHSAARPVATTIVFEEDICRFFVAVSVKVVLDSAGRRPSGGHFSTNAQIERAISQANFALILNDVPWRLFLDEIVDLQQSQYFRVVDDAHKLEFEDDARTQRPEFLWRDNAINFYVVDDLLNGAGVRIGGSCSFPTQHEIIVVNNRGILNEGVGWLHEIGHFLSLTHTFECLAGNCPQSTCTGLGAFHDGISVQCPDNCPHDENVMSYNSFDTSDAVFSACQIREMGRHLFDADGLRRHVLRRVLPTGQVLPRILPDLPSFIRGDSNSSGVVDISDALNTLGVLLLGTGAIACPDAADANDDDQLDISDAVATLSFLFLGQSPIAPPGALTCSPDGSEDSLAACTYDEAHCPRSTADP